VLAMVLLVLMLMGFQNAYPALTESDLFMLEEIAVTGNRLLSTREVVEASGLEPGLNLFGADLETAEKAVAGIPVVSEALVIRQPPAGLLISVSEREPVALVSTQTLLMGVDAAGDLFGLPRAVVDLPVITGLERSATDSSTHAALVEVARFAATLKQSASSFLNSVSEIHVADRHHPDDLQVILMESALRLRMGGEEALSQVQNLEAYVRKGSFELDRPAYVDLRYRNQVVAGLQTIDP